MPYCNYFCKKIIMDRRSFIKSGLLAAAVGAVAGPKAIAKNVGRMEENFAIWDFELSAEDMEQIASLDLPVHKCSTLENRARCIGCSII